MDFPPRIASGGVIPRVYGCHRGAGGPATGGDFPPCLPLLVPSLKDRSSLAMWTCEPRFSALTAHWPSRGSLHGRRRNRRR